MRIEPECLPCLIQRGLREILKATGDPAKRLKAAIAIVKIIAENLSEEATPSDLGALRERAIKLETGNQDVYAKEKEDSNRTALKILPKLRGELSKLDDEFSRFRLACAYATIANSIEFDIPEHDFSPEDILKLFESGRVEVDDTGEIYRIIKASKKVALLLDNAGEIVIDKLLAEQIKSLGAKLTVVVKNFPIMNDATVADVKLISLKEVADNVLAVDVECVGFSMSKLPERIRKELLSSDLIVAKGMAHYESLTEESVKVPVAYLLVAKCSPVARSLGVKVGNGAIKLVKPRKSWG
ncbi:TPA: DUF89 family protein [Candidatus Bathyarchaeota archaeon]|nr:DUF89 family protein [Candidatus Bathyarchaeota archaeon]